MFLPAKAKQLARTLHDYGYDYLCGNLIQLGIQGFSSDRGLGKFRDVYDAAEYLIPIVRDDEFRNRVQRRV